MPKRILLLILPLALIILAVGAYALMPAEEPPVVPEAAEVEEVTEEPAPVVDPVVAAAPAQTSVALTVAEAPQTATLIVEGTSLAIRTPEGATLADAMAALKEAGQLDYETRSFAGLGAFVEEIQGKANTSDFVWILHVNGKKSATGISQVRISSGDVIEWKYEQKY